MFYSRLRCVNIISSLQNTDFNNLRTCVLSASWTGWAPSMGRIPGCSSSLSETVLILNWNQKGKVVIKKTIGWDHSSTPHCVVRPAQGWSPPAHTATQQPADTTTATQLPGGEVTAAAAVVISSQISSVATSAFAVTAAAVAAMASGAAGGGGEGDFKAWISYLDPDGHPSLVFIKIVSLAC